jgi:predicted DsbA family dithiol-disulfide isomerase
MVQGKDLWIYCDRGLGRFSTFMRPGIATRNLHRRRTALRTIEVFADVRCPFAHVGLRRIIGQRQARGLDLPLLIRAWPLELVNGEPLDGELVAKEIDALRAQIAPDLLTGFDRARFPSTSIPALALSAGAYAIRPEIGERVALALRWALFEEGKDIASVEVLLDIAQGAGIALPRNCEVDRVREDLAEGRARGVIGSPHFFIGDTGYFCPTLDITHTEDGLHIAGDPATFDAFIESAYSAT